MGRVWLGLIIKMERTQVERANIPSVKTIIKNGGKLERSFEFDLLQVLILEKESGLC